ncbi:alginate export family protein [Asticcacaulis sp. YBE204]|uniref:alginate export family protein n=1 Tax=Asticcacaulis sp. YBE204 TaxID=1282363 RepID=UPI0003C3ED13|nr:alginate export family protein [Asticcacaulis sp. YBE204]ESQ78345.1 hypothetical protein AEYBE204_14330 [Asticcacaulis sp. YBE204]
MALNVAPALAEDTFSEALAAGKPILESRLRYEGVDQAGLKEGHALTLRSRIGFQSSDFKNLKFLVEFEDTRALDDDYNSTTNGKTQYPAVNDPTVTELNRLQVVWTPSSFTTVTAGRQRIILDDARFIGNVGWRQDEQTFDALKIDTTLGKFAVSYAYLFQVNRVLGETADWDSDSHLLNVTLPISEALKLQAFDYALDFENAPANSTNTLGLRATGQTWLSSVKLAYSGYYAKQTDYGYNTADFDLAAYNADAALTWDMFTFKVGYEVFEGNGTRGFITPLATTHAFNGWSDALAFSGNKTHANGFKNLSYGLTVAGYTHPSFPLIKNPTLTLVYHDLETERLSQSIGTEFDAQFAAGLTKNVSLLLKYADFERANTAMPASRTKVWVGFEYKL